jgi:hypothetical protein
VVNGKHPQAKRTDRRKIVMLHIVPVDGGKAHRRAIGQDDMAILRLWSLHHIHRIVRKRRLLWGQGEMRHAVDLRA